MYNTLSIGRARAFVMPCFVLLKHTAVIFSVLQPHLL
jgi:hypothetical protein